MAYNDISHHIRRREERLQDPEFRAAYEEALAEIKKFDSCCRQVYEDVNFRLVRWIASALVDGVRRGELTRFVVGEAATDAIVQSTIAVLRNQHPQLFSGSDAERAAAEMAEHDAIEEGVALGDREIRAQIAIERSRLSQAQSVVDSARAALDSLSGFQSQ